MPDISNLSVEELRKLTAQAEALIESKKDQAIEDAYNQIIEIANSAGLTLEQFIEYGSHKRKKTTRKSVEPRYRNKIIVLILGLDVVNSRVGWWQNLKRVQSWKTS